MDWLIGAAGWVGLIAASVTGALLLLAVLVIITPLLLALVLKMVIRG